MIGIVNIETAAVVHIERVNDRQHHQAVEEQFPGMQNLVNGLIEGKAIVEPGSYLIEVDPYCRNGHTDIRVTVRKL